MPVIQRSLQRNWMHGGSGVVLVSTMLCVCLCDTAPVQSQGFAAKRTAHSRDKTREYIDDYSNSLGPEIGFDRSSQPASQGQVDVKALKPLLHSFADSTTQLTFDLNDQMAQTPGLRQIYTEGLRLSGAAVSIHKRADKFGVDGTMLDDLRQLDADWRELAYRMESARSLSDDSRSLVDDINGEVQRIRQLINMKPQFDRRQLNLKAAGLAADLENLQEDIISELGNSPDSQFYRRSINRARQVILNMVAVVRDERSDSGAIVEEYKQFETIFSPLVVKLRSEDDRYIERDLRKVAASSNDIHQLLLLPRKMDQSQFVYLAKTLKRDVDEFFERTPLILIMRLSNSKLAVPAADQLSIVCSQFVEVVSRGGDQTEIIDSFRKLEQAGSGFNDVFQEIDSDRASAVLNRINQSIASLRSSLHIHSDDFNGQGAADLAASIQNFTDQLEATANRWFGQDRQPFAADCLQEVSDLGDRVAKLHDDIVAGRPIADLRTEMADVYENWRRVYAYLGKCQTDDRAAFGRIATSLTPALVDLRTMIMQ